MNAKKCDLCGKYYTNDKNEKAPYILKKYINENINAFSAYSTLDLCETCYKLLLKFISDRSGRGGQKTSFDVENMEKAVAGKCKPPAETR